MGKPNEREEYKKFFDDYKKINEEDKEKKIEILFITNDLNRISTEPERYKLVIDVYNKN